ncbi:MAG: succinate dehydrogenase cytochrome b subunit [Holophagaceae bacterium]|nr:succinate dehydrogenase cytochrome b subunit [Holophagaceae bacterium]
MPKEASFLASSIGKKIVMAVTGIMLVGFVVGHMAGNLQLYLPAHGGEHPLDAYGHFLRTMLHGAGIWIARGGLLVAALLHIWAAVTLTKMNMEARPVAYKEVKSQASTLASRSMRVSGFIVLSFLVFHLLHLTLGKIGPFEEGKVFQNVVQGFQSPVISGFYILAMVCLFGHLRHGVWSMLQTLGLSHPSYNTLRDRLAFGVALLVVGANISFPLAVLAGFVKL